MVVGRSSQNRASALARLSFDPHPFLRLTPIELFVCSSAPLLTCPCWRGPAPRVPKSRSKIPIGTRCDWRVRSKQVEVSKPTTRIGESSSPLCSPRRNGTIGKEAHGRECLVSEAAWGVPARSRRVRSCPDRTNIAGVLTTCSEVRAEPLFRDFSRVSGGESRYRPEKWGLSSSLNTASNSTWHCLHTKHVPDGREERNAENHLAEDG